METANMSHNMCWVKRTMFFFPLLYHEKCTQLNFVNTCTFTHEQCKSKGVSSFSSLQTIADQKPEDTDIPATSGCCRLRPASLHWLTITASCSELTFNLLRIYYFSDARLWFPKTKKQLGLIFAKPGLILSS